VRNIQISKSINKIQTTVLQFKKTFHIWLEAKDKIPTVLQSKEDFISGLKQGKLYRNNFKQNINGSPIQKRFHIWLEAKETIQE